MGSRCYARDLRGWRFRWFPVGVGENPFPISDCLMILLLRQHVLSGNTLTEQLLTPPLPRNPAVTFCFCLFRKLPWKRFPIYFLAQLLGGFVGSGVVYANYINAINQVEGHGIRTVPPSPTATAGIFCTYPQAFLTKASQFFSEFIASTILMFVIFALKDDSNPGAMGKTGAGMLFPLALFFLIFGLGACFGYVPLLYHYKYPITNSDP
jgi:hypothetical protein